MKRAREEDVPRDRFELKPCAVTIASLRGLMLDLVFSGRGYDARKFSGDKAELPGPLPIALNRKYLAVVQSQPYMVCEKSDGERGMLLLLHTARGGVPAGAYLFNRSFEASSFPRGAEYAALLAPSGPTLLEGELLQRADDAGTGTGALAVFMMFDAVTVNGKDYGGAPLPERLQAVGNFVRLPFRTADDAAKAEGRPRLPLFLLGKLMLDKRQARDILAKISGMPGHGSGTQPLTAPLESELGLSSTGGSGASRVYRDGIRVNGTDGLIFTPSAPSYRDLFSGASLPTPLLKWKYLEENTVDFSLSADDLQAAAEVQGGGGVSVPLAVNAGGREDIPLTSTLLTPQAAAAYLTLSDRVGRGVLIVEAGFEPATSSWAIRRVRDRKTRSNFVRTAWSTLEVLAEGITQQEIETKLG
jgi:hypothetical protein